MEWLKKHGDTLAVIAVFAGGFWLLNEKMETRFNEVDRRFSGLEKEMAIVKTVLIMKHIMPSDLAHQHECKADLHD